jgi:hypothetical protein
LLVAVLGPAAATSWAWARLYSRENVRTIAGAWIASNLPTGATLGMTAPSAPGSYVITAGNVFAGDSNFDMMTVGTISPLTPTGRSWPASSQMRISRSGASRPDEPSLCARGVLAEMTGAASVSPYPWKIGIPTARRTAAARCQAMRRHR